MINQDFPEILKIKEIKLQPEVESRLETVVGRIEDKDLQETIRKLGKVCWKHKEIARQIY